MMYQSPLNSLLFQHHELFVAVVLFSAKMADLSQQVATALKFCFNLLSVFLTTALSDTLANSHSLTKSLSAQDESSSLPTTELLLCIDAVLECEVLRAA